MKQQSFTAASLSGLLLKLSLAEENTKYLVEITKIPGKYRSYKIQAERPVPHLLGGFETRRALRHERSLREIKRNAERNDDGGEEVAIKETRSLFVVGLYEVHIIPVHASAVSQR